MGNRHGGLCLDGWDVSQLCGAAGRRSNPAGRYICGRVPAKAGGAVRRAPETPGQSRSRGINHEFEESGVMPITQTQTTAQSRTKQALDFAARLKSKFGELVSEPVEFRGEISLKISDIERIPDICAFAKSDLGFDYLVD